LYLEIVTVWAYNNMKNMIKLILTWISDNITPI